MEDTLFVVANWSVMPVWLLLALAPRWRVTEVVSRGLWLPLLLATFYVVLVLTNLNATEGDFFSLQGVATIFADRQALLAGWVHYLCFDLFIGSWIARDAQQAGVPHWLVVPCLFLTLMFGPAGLLLYVVIIRARGRTLLRCTHDRTAP